MAECVDKEKLQKDFIEHFCNGTNCVFIFIDDILKFIDDEPTADVAEVKHGKWIGKQLDTFRKYEVTCSNCDWIGIENYDSYDNPFEFNYCPSCGTKMDLED